LSKWDRLGRVRTQGRCVRPLVTALLKPAIARSLRSTEADILRGKGAAFKLKRSASYDATHKESQGTTTSSKLETHRVGPAPNYHYPLDTNYSFSQISNTLRISFFTLFFQLCPEKNLFEIIFL